MNLKLFSAAVMALIMSAGAVNAQTIKTGDKVLVAYYSRTGNTRAIADKIQKQLNADIFEIIPAQGYPADYRQTTEQAKKEIAEGIRPALKNQPVNLNDYQVIFVGSPCWWGTIASPVATFLAENDFNGKVIVPFMTHGGSGLGRSVGEIKNLAAGAEVTGAKAFWGSSAQNAGSDVNEWVKGLQND